MRSNPERLPRWILLGNPESRRVRGFVEAAQRLGLREVAVVSYASLLNGNVPRDTVAPGTVVRIESPGENWEVEKLILKAGIEPLQSVGGVPVREAELDAKPASRGEIHRPRQWYLGFRRILQRLQADWGARGVTWMSSPDEIATTFDKLACQQLWAQRGLPVPAFRGDVATYHQLRTMMREPHRRLFIKLRHGYSAIGAVALEWRGDLVRALTTVEVVWSAGRPRLFLTKRTRVLRREFEIAWLIDTLATEAVLVEEWLPKARWRGRPFDLRVVTIGGRASHVVGRAHPSPFTNLNLDATRIPAEELEQRLGGGWAEALACVERAAAAFPRSTALGIDLLVRPSRRRFALLEANAFGDFLPGWLSRGESTYEAELRFLLGRERRDAS